MSRSTLALAAAVFVLTLLPYLQTRRFDFVLFDDGIYVVDSPAVKSGLTWASVKWAFTDTATTSNWHPLTYLSLMADVELFGVNPGAMHLHNALLHAADAALLFLLLLLVLEKVAGSSGCETVWSAALQCRSGSGGLQSDDGGRRTDVRCEKAVLKPANHAALLAAAFGALFWSLHPLRVESVAWISSRKDVLCVFWYLLGALAYVRKAPRTEWLLPVSFGCFALAYMSKPTAIVFPLTLIAAEYALHRRIRWRDMGVFLFMALVFALITVCVQEEAISNRLSAVTRALNAVAAVGAYLSQTVLPVRLCAFYPYHELVSQTDLAAGILVLILVVCGLEQRTLLLLRQYPPVPFLGRPRGAGGAASVRAAEGGAEALPQEPDDTLLRACLLGAVWFFVALLPVIGVIQVGRASHADRYTYLAGVGVSIALAAGVAQMAACAAKAARGAVAGCCLAVLAALGFLCDRQVATWRDSETLFTHANRVTEENFIAHGNLATVCFREKRYVEAFDHFRLLAAQTYPKQGIQRLIETLDKLASKPSQEHEILTMPIDEKNDPLAAKKYHALGLIACDRNLTYAAEALTRKSIGLDPGDGYAWELLGYVLGKDRRYDEALAALGEAQRRLPRSPQVRLMIVELQRMQRGAKR